VSEENIWTYEIGIIQKAAW